MPNAARPHDRPSQLRSRPRTSPMLNSIASAGRRVLPNQWDLIALAAIMAVLTAIAQSYHGISAPLPAPNEPVVSLDYWNLPYYALRPTLRMVGALIASFVFTFAYATLAANPTFSTGAGRRRILGLEEGEERVGSTTGFRNSPVVETKYLF